MRVVRLIFDVLREIFDEAGYERFLTRSGLAGSRRAYTDFLREKYAGAPRPRCC
jgi:hypothetical protein